MTQQAGENFNTDQEIDKAFNQATHYYREGKIQLAHQSFLHILKASPTHLGALINFAQLLIETGYQSAAKTAYLQAVQHHPGSMLARVNLGNLYFLERKFDSAKECFEQVIELAHSVNMDDSQDMDHRSHLAHAYQGLALIHFEAGQSELAAQAHRLGFELETVRQFTAIRTNAPCVLVLIGGRGGDLPWRSILGQVSFNVDTLAVEYYRAGLTKIRACEDYDFVLNAIGDADSSLESLSAAQEFLRLYGAPKLPSLGRGACTHAPAEMALINPPVSVMQTGRLNNAQRLKAIPFVKTPRSMMIERRILQDDSELAAKMLDDMLGDKLDSPLLVRSLGFQTGKHFEYVLGAGDLSKIVKVLPGEDFLVMEFLNAKDAQGYYRKYRVMFIGEEIYPLHLALSLHWKVHYFSAAMKDSPENRAKEKYFLENMSDCLGPKAMGALKAIQKQIALDYAGLDFSLNEQGEILFFEANATMIIADIADDEIWNYRREAIARAKTAVNRLLISLCRTA